MILGKSESIIIKIKAIKKLRLNYFKGFEEEESKPLKKWQDSRGRINNYKKRKQKWQKSKKEIKNGGKKRKFNYGKKGKL